MPRPRFEKLDPERRASILAVATEEFAEHGFEAASYNQIIARTGLSKGAIYYYFDDKEDLYTTVLRDAVERLIMGSGDMASAKDAESFWAEFEAWYVRSLGLFQREPASVGLARSVAKAMARGAATGAIAELRQLARGWMDQFIAQGQSLNAIRSDLPEDLLVNVLMGLEESIDLWLGERIGDMSDEEIASTATMLTQLYRQVACPSSTPKPKKKKARR